MTSGATSEPGMERDPRDGEAIVPTHNTRLSTQTKLLKELHSAMKCWQEAVDDVSPKILTLRSKLSDLCAIKMFNGCCRNLSA